MFLFRFPGSEKQAIQRSLPTHRRDSRRAKTHDYLSTKTEQCCANNHRMAIMKSKKKSTRKRFSEQEIDKVVESQADEDLAWGKAIDVRRAKPTALSLPIELAARAEFLARLHREENVEKWLARIIKERVELEEVAFSEAKRAMSLRNGV